jgi:hypothetical protein
MRAKTLLLGGAAAFAGWRFWSSRRAATEPITFDWEVPPPVEPAPPPPAQSPAPSAADDGVATPADRERESQADSETKFEQATEAESEERGAAAERLREDPPPAPEEPS